MGSGWHEWPLMIFTVFGQCVAGGFIVLALALLKGDLRAEAQQLCYCLHVWFMGADGHWLYRLYASSWFTDARL